MGKTTVWPDSLTPNLTHVMLGCGGLMRSWMVIPLMIEMDVARATELNSLWRGNAYAGQKPRVAEVDDDHCQ